MKQVYSFLILMLSIVVVGCDQGDERLEEKARIEGRASSEAGIQAENQNLAQRSSAMEADLAQRHRFYQAVEGTYEGELQTEQGVFRIRLTMVPSLYPYRADRVRQLEEITADLNNLYFNAQVVQWNSANPLSAVGCRVSSVRPDLLSGQITIASESCPNLYSLRISDQIYGASESAPSSSAIAAQVADGRLSRIGALTGDVRPSTNATIYRFAAVRVDSDAERVP